MSQSVILEKSTLDLDDLDAFVDASVSAMDEQEFKTYQVAAERIMVDTKRRVSGSDAAASEQTQSV